jgi:ribosome-associated translation inhibitor RaiA
MEIIVPVNISRKDQDLEAKSIVKVDQIKTSIINIKNTDIQSPEQDQNLYLKVNIKLKKLKKRLLIQQKDKKNHYLSKLKKQVCT